MKTESLSRLNDQSAQISGMADVGESPQRPEIIALRRVTIVAISIGVPALFYFLGYTVRETYTHNILIHSRVLSWFGQPITLAAMLFIYAARDILSFVPVARRIWINADLGAMWGPGVAVALSFFALGLASSPPDARVTVLNLGSVSFLPSSASSPARLTIAIPFAQDNPNQSSPEGIAIAPQSDSEEILTRIGRALADCGRVGAVKPKIEIHGFHSSKGPEDRIQFMIVNLKVAQSRAEAVKHILVQSADSWAKRNDVLDIQTFPWKSADEMQIDLGSAAQIRSAYERMQQDIRFQDEISGQYDSVLGNLTRRAEIRVVSAGSCDLVN